jgi:hypothetical protein
MSRTYCHFLFFRSFFQIIFSDHLFISLAKELPSFLDGTLDSPPSPLTLLRAARAALAKPLRFPRAIAIRARCLGVLGDFGFLEDAYAITYLFPVKFSAKDFP